MPALLETSKGAPAPRSPAAPMPAVLIVDDLLSIHEMLEAVIQPTGMTTAFATDGEKALGKYKQEKFDVVLADIDMKPMDGITLLKQLKAYDPTCVVVIMTAYASTDSAVQALKHGAFDYLQKPFKVEELLQTLRRGLEFRQTSAQRHDPSAAPSSGAEIDIEAQLPGQSAKVKKLAAQVKKLIGVRTPVLLTGEPGTGKKFIAELLHRASQAPDAPCIRIDCGLSTEEQFQAGLLGSNGAGGHWVEQAKGGTLLLQHIELLPLELQKPLVSVLRNAGHSFRLVCTSSVDLEKLSDEGRFHDELFYRVASLPVHLPALQERLEDLPLLIKAVAARASNPLFDTRQVEFSEDALAALGSYRWPGNLTELTQVVTQVVSTSDARTISLQKLPVRIHNLKDWPSLAEYLASQEKQYLEMVLHACRGDKARAAQVLGCDPAKLG